MKTDSTASNALVGLCPFSGAAMAKDGEASQLKPVPPLDSVSERKSLMEDWEKIKNWNRTETEWKAKGLVPSLITAQARMNPKATALAASSRSITFGELESQGNALAKRLSNLGVGPDVAVALVHGRCPSFAMAALGILKSGGAYLPIDPSYPRERIEFILNDAQPGVVIAESWLLDRIPEGPWTILSWDQENLEGDAAGPEIEIKPESLAYIIYTSGSTGKPKGVEVTHANLLNLVCWHNSNFDITSQDRATQYASPGFDAAVWEIWPYLAAGASVHFVEEEIRLNAAAICEWLVAKSITATFMPTSIAERLIQMPWPASSPLRYLLTGADVLSHYPPDELPFVLVNNYGPTETTVVASSGIVRSNLYSDRKPSIGRPIANAQIYILDEAQHPVAIGQEGEIYIGGAGVARGYRNHPDLTALRFIPNPFAKGEKFYRTGDRARFLPDGQIEFLGRVDEQIKIRGYRIEPNEIVAAVQSDSRVEGCVVVAREDVPGEKQLVAYLVFHPGQEANANDLADMLKKSVPDYMIPSLFVRMNFFPLTPHGKVDKAALPIPDESNILRAKAHCGPRNETERKLSEILENLLSLPSLDINDNFFMLGGHSLLGTQVINRVRTHFGVDLGLRVIFKSPTVSGMAAEIDRLLAAKSNKKEELC